MTDPKDPNYWVQRKNSLTRIKDDIAKVRQYVDGLPPDESRLAAAEQSSNKPITGQQQTGLLSDWNKPSDDVRQAPVDQTASQQPARLRSDSNKPANATSNRPPAANRAVRNGQTVSTNRASELPPNGYRNGVRRPDNARGTMRNGLQNTLRERNARDPGLRGLASGRSSEHGLHGIWRATSPVGRGGQSPASADTFSDLSSPQTNSLYNADPYRFGYNSDPPNVYDKPPRRHHGDMLGIQALQLRLPEVLRASNFAGAAPRDGVASPEAPKPKQVVEQTQQTEPAPLGPPTPAKESPEPKVVVMETEKVLEPAAPKPLDAEPAERQPTVVARSLPSNRRMTSSLPPPSPSSSLHNEFTEQPQSALRTSHRALPVLSARAPSVVDDPRYHGYLHSRYPHILHDALIPTELSAPPPVPTLLPAADSDDTDSVSMTTDAASSTPQAAVTLRSSRPVQNVYVNTVSNQPAPEKSRRSPQVQVDVDVDGYLNNLLDQELYDNLIPELLRGVMDELRSQDQRDRLRWERIKFNFFHDDDCHNQFMDSMITYLLEEILPEILTEMIGQGPEWLLDAEELEARAILDDLLTIDLTLIVQSLCRETMNNMIDGYLQVNRFNLNFDEVLAIDVYERALTAEIRLVVRESLDDLLYGERQRRIAYEVYKLMMTELIREVQEAVISEAFFEVAVLDPMLDELVFDSVVDEEAPKVAQDALHEMSLMGLKQLEHDVNKEFRIRVMESLCVDQVLGAFAMQGLTRTDSEGADRALNALLFVELFVTILDINRSHRITLQNDSLKFMYDKVFTGVAADALLDRLVEETDQNLCDGDVDEVEKAENSIRQNMDLFVFGAPDKYRLARAAAAEANKSPSPVASAAAAAAANGSQKKQQSKPPVKRP